MFKTKVHWTVCFLKLKSQLVSADVETITNLLPKHYIAVLWASWCLKSTALPLFVQQANSTECITALHYCLFVQRTGGFPSQRVSIRQAFPCHDVLVDFVLLCIMLPVFVGLINSSLPSAAYMRRCTRSALVQIMACRLFGAKPLYKPKLGYCQLDPSEQTSMT